MEVAPQREPFAFTGNGGEYFRIWIVNLCLSLVTLGIYSAWAKVRRTQYFYRHTSVAGASFDYHGDPKIILKGRIIALLLFGTYSLMGHFNPIAALVVFALIMAVMPWMLVRSFRFRLSNTSYRGLRFSFHGKTGDAYVNFLLLPLASYLTAGLLWPLAHQQITRYTRSSSAFGDRYFKFHGKAGAFYKPYLALFGAAILMIIVAGAFGFLLSKVFAGHTLGKTQFAILGIAVFAVFYIGLLLLAVPYVSARLQNIIWNNTTLDRHSFSSNARARDLFGIMFSNLLLIIVTLGLYKPFADIRLARYRIQRLNLLAVGNLDEFVAGLQSQATATGEEMADMFDMDFAF